MPCPMSGPVSETLSADHGVNSETEGAVQEENLVDQYAVRNQQVSPDGV